MNDASNMTPGERDYYRVTWGFDPVADRQVTPEGQFRYEAVFTLDQDPPLHAAGIIMLARVDWSQGLIRNRIIFRLCEKEVTINCVHTVIYEAPAGEILDADPETLLQHAVTTEKRPAALPPWEHFAALKSYVGGIADVGIGTLLRADWLPAEFHLEQNTRQLVSFSLEEQVITNLQALAPGAFQALFRDALLEMLDDLPLESLDHFFHQLRTTKKLRDIILPDPEILLSILEFTPAEWLQYHLNEIITKLGLGTAFFANPDFLTFLKQRIPDAPWDLCAAQFPRTYPKILTQLADHEDPNVRRAVAANENTLGYILEKLAYDPEKRVRIAVVRNNACPPNLFEVLVATANKEVHRVIVEALRLQPEVVRQLAYSPDIVVRRAVARMHSLAFPTYIKLARDSDLGVRCLLAARAQLPQTICVKLARDPIAKVRRLVAANPSTPYGTLAYLSNDSDLKVRCNVARNSNLTPAIRHQLEHDPDAIVRGLTVRHFRK